MKSFELRQRFLEFFKERGHQIVPSSSILPSDPSVLFTTAGMQQFKPYYTEEKSPYGPNVVSCQKCIRTSDIDEIGDESHLTFIEMLGNFSFGGYFKEKAIKMAYEFLFDELKLPTDKVFFTVFKGDKNIPLDIESVDILKKIGITEDKIKKYPKEDNFWGPTGESGPCGPSLEIYLNGIEIWNLVFNEYYMDKDKNLTPLSLKGVDTGMGLERLAMSFQNKLSVFETDLFEPIISEIKKYGKGGEKAERIIADHIKSAVFMASEGVVPLNVEKGYILRRIIRRAIRYGRILNIPPGFLITLAKIVIEIYKESYPELISNQVDILTTIEKEEERFGKTLEKGLKIFEKVTKKGNILGVDVFHLYDTYGFPLELTIELAKEKNLEVDEKEFNELLKKHREISRAGAEKKFGGIGKETDFQATCLHTATHLLHAALREVLGTKVKQMGSDITSERLRFDFFYFQKVNEDEIKKIEDLVNKKIKEDIIIKKEEMLLKEATESGALSFFKDRYPEKVSVYSINDFSKEICAGPHANRTKELGSFKIINEESAGANIRRIRAILK